MANEVKSDIEIAQQAQLNKIYDIAADIGLAEDDYEPYGHYKAKVNLDVLKNAEKEGRPDGKLILVTGISPTPAGEGKSTVTVGLGQALNRLGRKAIVALREPSLGPTMGIKGGAAGGGHSQVLPMEDINLHFTGDLHAITSAHNALSAIIDNHLHQGNELGIDPRRIQWKRVIDMNDRALRQVNVGLGGPTQGVPREDSFDITVASEVMAVLCLSKDLEDLKERLSKIVVAFTYDRSPVTVADLQAEGAMALLLKEALKPNLVQTLENTPAFIHGGPFANIAHGCNSLTATKMSLKLADYTVTEAGFGADLGAEKFINIKSRIGELKPDATVVVATVRALKMQGGVPKDELKTENVEAVKAGISNLKRHVNILRQFGLPVVVALNHFIHDTEEEIAVIQNWCQENGVPCAVSKVWAEGGAGGESLAEEVLQLTATEENQSTPHASNQPTFTYDVENTLEEKIRAIATNIYGAKDVAFSKKAKTQLNRFKKYGWENYPVCMAKTQYSFTDDPSELGSPENFTITINELRPSLGAGFIVALTGDIMTMPGLPKVPSAVHMDVNDDGDVKGLF